MLERQIYQQVRVQLPTEDTTTMTDIRIFVCSPQSDAAMHCWSVGDQLLTNAGAAIAAAVYLCQR